jgi:hypothetical protein
MYLYSHAHTYTHTRARARTHTHTHTHAHTQTHKHNVVIFADHTIVYPPSIGCVWREHPLIQSTIERRYHTYNRIRWHVSWHYRINVNGQEYTDEDLEYLMRRNLGINMAQWECLSERDLKEFWANEM